MRDVGRRGEVRNAHEWIRRRLDEHATRRGCHRVGDSLRIPRVDITEQHPVVLKDTVEKSERSAVHVLAADDVVAAPKHFHQRIQACSAAGEGKTVASTLQGGYVALKGFACGILAARVLVALLAAESVLDVSRRQVDGCHDRPGKGVRALASMNRACAKPPSPAAI